LPKQSTSLRPFSADPTARQVTLRLGRRVPQWLAAFAAVFGGVLWLALGPAGVLATPWLEQAVAGGLLAVGLLFAVSLRRRRELVVALGPRLVRVVVRRALRGKHVERQLPLDDVIQLKLERSQKGEQKVFLVSQGSERWNYYELLRGPPGPRLERLVARLSEAIGVDLPAEPGVDEEEDADQAA
jgi:hypothetical protein